MARIIRYANTASHGPAGTEYLLPASSDRFDDWLSRFVEMSADDVATVVHKFWTSGHSSVMAIAAGLRTFEPRSLYHLEPCEWNDGHDFLLFENERHVMLIPEQSEAEPDSKVNPELLDLIRCFDGIRFGYNPHPDDDTLRSDSGFEKLSTLKRISESDESYFWECDDSVIGGFWFFSTSCGNRLCRREDGTIAKWNIGSGEIDDAFESLESFAESFVECYVECKIDEHSPLYY